MEDNQDKSSKSVKEMTQDEFDREWERLFPIGEDLPASLKKQAS